MGCRAFQKSHKSTKITKKIETKWRLEKKERPESDGDPILVDLGVPRGSQNRQKNASKNGSKNGHSKKLQTQRKGDLKIYLSINTSD